MFLDAIELIAGPLSQPGVFANWAALIFCAGTAMLLTAAVLGIATAAAMALRALMDGRI